MILYGIKNCNTVKKAMDWLKQQDIAYNFHDYKKQGISPEKLKDWSRQQGSDTLINRKGTTWRKLDEAQKEKAQDEAGAIELMVANTSMIKRPIIEKEGKIITIGFDEGTFAEQYKG